MTFDRGSGIDLRHQLKAKGVSVPVIFHHGQCDPVFMRGRTAIWMRRISNQAFLNPRTDRAAEESVGRVKLSALVPGPCTLYFGTMHHRTTFAKLISEFGLSGTSPPNQYRYTAPRGPSFPKDWGHTFPRSRRWFLLFHSHIGR